MSKKYQTEGLDESVTRIVDTIACADGGATFVTLLSVIRQCDAQDSEAAGRVIDVVTKFARLCQVAEKALNGEI